MGGGGPIDNIEDEMSMFFNNKKAKKKESKKSNKGFFSFIFSKKKNKEDEDDYYNDDEKEEEESCIKPIESSNKIDIIINNEKINCSNKEIKKIKIEENNNLEYINTDESILIKEPEKNIIFEENEEELDTKYLKRNKLNINLIHFDLKITNKENYS